MRITYPFAAVPNQIARGGHGAINLAVLTVLLSHGKTTASIQTMANEIGCGHNSVRAAIKYWLKNGSSNGVLLHSKTVNGAPTIYEIEIVEMLGTTMGISSYTPTGSGRGGIPKTGRVPLPDQVGKEEPRRKTNKKTESGPYKYGDNSNAKPRGPTNQWAPISDVIHNKRKYGDETV